MSIVRFSTDCYQSDVYVYESNGGYRLHIATQRYISDVPRPKLPEELSDAIGLISYIQDCLEWVRNAKLESIGLDYDGQSFSFDAWEECLCFLKELQKAGYFIPDYVFEIAE